MTLVELAVEVAGWTGASLILLAYLLLSAGRLTGQSLAYQAMNVVGAAGFIVNGWWHRALPSAALNVAMAIDRSLRIMANLEEKRIVDLSHVIEHGMTTYKGLPGPHICDFWEREGTAANYDDGSTFQIGRIDMVANTGTYVDSPFHRYADGADLADLPLPSLADLPGDCRSAAVGKRDRDRRGGIRRPRSARQGRAGSYRMGPALADRCLFWRPSVPDSKSGGLAGRKRRGDRWDRQLQHRQYAPAGAPRAHQIARRRHPDLRAYDDAGSLPDEGFRFSAVPPKVRGMGTFPVRAYAVLG